MINQMNNPAKLSPEQLTAIKEEAKAEMRAEMRAESQPQVESKRPSIPRLNWEKAALYAIPTGIVVLGFMRDMQGMVTHTWAVVSSLSALIIAGVGVMVLIGAIQILRETRIFDRYGVASEMATVQDRVGTDAERDGDAKAIAIKHAGISVLIALTLLSYVLLPQ